MPVYSVSLYQVIERVLDDGSIVYLNTDDDHEGPKERLEGDADINLVLNYIREHAPDAGEPSYLGYMPLEESGAFSRLRIPRDRLGIRYDLFSVPRYLKHSNFRGVEVCCDEESDTPDDLICSNAGRFLGRANYVDTYGYRCVQHPEGRKYVHEYVIYFELVEQHFPDDMVPAKNHVVIDIDLTTGRTHYRLCLPNSSFPDSRGDFFDITHKLTTDGFHAIKDALVLSPEHLGRFTSETTNFFPPGCASERAHKGE